MADEGRSAVTRHPSPVTLDLVAALVDKSLLHPTTAPDGASRYAMLETVREFGLDRLAASGEAAATRDRHAAYFAALVGEAAPAPTYLASLTEAGWGSRLATDLANLRIAFERLLEAGDGESALLMAGALGWFWFYDGDPKEGHAWLERALSEGAADVPAARALAMEALGLVTTRLGSPDVAIVHAEEALALFRTLGDEAGAARALDVLGNAVWDSGDPVRGEALLREALAIFRQFGAIRLVIAVLNDLGFNLCGAGDFVAARLVLEEAVRLLESLDQQRVAVSPLGNLGMVVLEQGDIARATELFGEALARFRSHGHVQDLSYMLEYVGVLAGARGDPERGARLFGAAAVIHEMTGVPVVSAARAWYEQAVAAVRARLAPSVFASAWTAGRALSLAEALDEAEAVVSPRPTLVSAASPDAAVGAGLTPREVEVLCLVAKGLTDREIGERLSPMVAHRTVTSHLTRIYAKLNVAGRAEATAWAVRHGLV
jgi:DNA-binding CsgD family transcriptional regulator/tetratricopeptide (TPR) repeat protein